MSARPSPLLGLAALVSLVGTACTTSETQPSAPNGTTVEEIASPVGTLPDGPSALQNMFDPEFPEPLVDPEQIISGGPPPDGIPPIDDPHFVPVADVDWLRDQEGVIAVEIDGDARAYPAQILIWHEIVNDTVGGVPVSVTYCPLCNSAVTFVRSVEGVETTFGTSGRLFASALVMYDRATESLWTHFDGRAVVGVLAGQRLQPIPSPLLSWGEFRAAYPDGLVLNKFRTGHSRQYGSNPYVGYDDPDGHPFLFNGIVDDRARAMQRVVGIELDGTARAWSLDAISDGEASVTHDQIAGRSLVIFWRDGQASALHQFLTDIGRVVGTVGVFSPLLEGQELTFQAREDEFVDDQTGSTWDITGRAVAGPLTGATLERLHHLDTFWFAWSTYQPDTSLIEP
ncbi:MAG: DUF3179 domain-containing protein [Acidimicrobiia bacterium]